jgi:hypothetical protein
MEILKRTLPVIIAASVGVFVGINFGKYIDNYEVGYITTLLVSYATWAGLTYVIRRKK